jgi:hypothetical protein
VQHDLQREGLVWCVCCLRPRLVRGDYYSDWGSEMSKETGGNAFPYSGTHQGYGGGVLVDDRGMSLRDYFAAKAMQAIIRRYDGHSFGGGPESPQYKELSDDAYCIADAMLKARDN